MGIFGIQLHKAVKCHELRLECYRVVEEDSGARQAMMLVRAGIEMIGSEAQARRCLSIDARARVRDRFGLMCTDSRKARIFNAEVWPRLARFCLQARAGDDVEDRD